MRNSWPSCCRVVVLSVVFFSDVAFGRPVPYPPPASSAPNFGKCSTPEIKFAKGLDNRKETAFEPNIGIISQFVCDSLTNTCGANAAAKAECAKAQAAANAVTPPKTGAQADAFNLVFGLKTDFAAVQPLDDQGNPNVGCAANRTTSGSPPSTSSPPPKTDSSLATSTNSNPGASDFGKCTTPQIKFAVGLDGRRETAFAPVDQQSYNHGSADNIGVISSFICLALTNTCGANDAAKTQCAQAQAAASAATPPQTGAQADGPCFHSLISCYLFFSPAFNLVFGLKTDFAAVQPISNTGQPVGVSNAKSAPSSNLVNTTDTVELPHLPLPHSGTDSFRWRTTQALKACRMLFNAHGTPSLFIFEAAR
ncbi:hypothetical protein BJV77DRAFT_993100 [Russula vinacea]|nr:hypothetical protein BJV77DRAFT_993100 [Russula vinacea]